MSYHSSAATTGITTDWCYRASFSFFYTATVIITAININNLRQIIDIILLAARFIQVYKKGRYK